jgi:CBS domain containing-hemolysin-like protein
VDARIYVDELNRVLGLHLPEDAGYDTLGGFVSTTLGRIPEPGEEVVIEGTPVEIEAVEGGAIASVIVGARAVSDAGKVK